MLTNIYKLQFFLLLLARVSKSSRAPSSDCLSFLDVAAFNRTTSVLSAPGFVESLTIPSLSQDDNYWLEPTGNATAMVTTYGPDGAGTRSRFLDYQKMMTVRIPGTGNKAGFNASAHRPSGRAKGTAWDEFMRYFADGGVGVVIALENHSTLRAVQTPEDSQDTVVFTAQPAKMYKVAIVVQYEVDMEITIQSPNVLSISMVHEYHAVPEVNPCRFLSPVECTRNEQCYMRQKMYEDDRDLCVWKGDDVIYHRGAFDNGVNFGGQTSGVGGHSGGVTKFKRNQCLDVKMSVQLAPTPSPSASAAAAHRGCRTTFAAFSLLVAASLALLW